AVHGYFGNCQVSENGELVRIVSFTKGDGLEWASEEIPGSTIFYLGPIGQGEVGTWESCHARGDASMTSIDHLQGAGITDGVADCTTFPDQYTVGTRAAILAASAAGGGTCCFMLNDAQVGTLLAVAAFAGGLLS